MSIDRAFLEFSTLTTHLAWAELVGDNQAAPERIVRSLEANPFLGIRALAEALRESLMLNSSAVERLQLRNAAMQVPQPVFEWYTAMIRKTRLPTRAHSSQVHGV